KTATKSSFGSCSEIGRQTEPDPALLLGKIVNSDERNADLRSCAQFQNVVNFPDDLDASLEIVPSESIRVVLQIVSDRNVRIKGKFVAGPRKTGGKSRLDEAAADFVEVVIVFQRRGVTRADVVLDGNEKFLCVVVAKIEMIIIWREIIDVASCDSEAGGLD